MGEIMMVSGRSKLNNSIYLASEVYNAIISGLGLQDGYLPTMHFLKTKINLENKKDGN